MIERLGYVLYWTFCIAAVVAALVAVVVLFGTEKLFAIVFAVFALIAYGVGRAIRYVLVGR